MTRKIRIKRAAQTDLEDIAEYSIEVWGSEQATSYIRRLDERMKKLTSLPKLGVRAEWIRAGYWKLREGRHVIYYRVAEDDFIEIIRVLHEKMDVRREFSLG